MEQFTFKQFINGAIVTVHVIDSTGKLYVAAGEGLEEQAAKAIEQMFNDKLAKHPALDILEELVETADLDKVFDKAETLLKELG